MGNRRGVGLVVGVAIILGMVLSSLMGMTGGVALADTVPAAITEMTDPLLAPAPTQPVGYYDYFGELLSPAAAAPR